MVKKKRAKIRQLVLRQGGDYKLKGTRKQERRKRMVIIKKRRK